MSRKITQHSVDAFLSDNPMKEANTRVDVENFESLLYLHGNLIAKKDMSGNIEISNAGWFSNTKKERLNGIPGVSISQAKGVWYLNGSEWNGEWIKI